MPNDTDTAVRVYLYWPELSQSSADLLSHRHHVLRSVMIACVKYNVLFSIKVIQLSGVEKILLD
jgi:hypothetical protein